MATFYHNSYIIVCVTYFIDTKRQNLLLVDYGPFMYIAAIPCKGQPQTQKLK